MKVKTISILVGTILAIGAVSIQTSKASEKVKMDVPVTHEYILMESETEPETETYIETTPETVSETVEELETETETETERKYFDVPLDESIQDHIFAECERYNIAPSFVIALIEHESNFKISASGDAGSSSGLMQIQKKWHKERMERLDCTDLNDPYQNITVGIDYLAELFNINEDVYWVLMAYNGGISYANKYWTNGNFSSYAIKITERAAEFSDMYDY